MRRSSTAWFGVFAIFAMVACGGTRPPSAGLRGPAQPLSIATSGGAGTAVQTWSDAESPIPVDSDDPVWGARIAPVTIVMFTDLECPFCARVQPVLRQIETTYGSDKVRIVWKNNPLPFHKNARPAAEAAMGVFAIGGSDAFFRFVSAAFAAQVELGPAAYERWARDAGVDLSALRRGLADHAWDGKIAKDMALANAIGANGTPTFFVNGVEIVGAQPFDTFKSAIDAELTKARAAIAAGMSPDRVYVEMSKQFEPNPPSPAQETNPSDDDKTVWQVVVDTSPTRGPDTALVTIVEFSDFQCPFCKRVEETLRRVRDTYGDKVRIVWKNEPLPFHDRAEPAAELAIFAWKEKGNAAFWAAHDRLFERSPDLGDPVLEEIAAGIGLNPKKAMDAVRAHKNHAVIDADTDLADDFAATGTPHFFINGRRLVGAEPFERFQSLIDEELKSAQAKVAGGTPAKRVYAEIMKTARAPEPPEKKSVALPSYAVPSKGSPRAKVVIQEFSDFQCPFCARVQPTLGELMSAYGDRVRLVFRHKPLPMHPDAPLAAEAAMEAFRQKGSAGFWKMHDLLFENAAAAGGLQEAALEAYAARIGLDVAAFRSALGRRVHQAAVEAESRVADDAGITGTPAFIINGYFISGAQALPKFRKAVDRALREK